MCRHSLSNYNPYFVVAVPVAALLQRGCIAIALSSHCHRIGTSSPQRCLANFIGILFARGAAETLPLRCCTLKQ
jgi:hypothetical protein